MGLIHNACKRYGEQPEDYFDYVKGTNITGFLKVANATVDQEVV